MQSKPDTHSHREGPPQQGRVRGEVLRRGKKRGSVKHYSKRGWSIRCSLIGRSRTVPPTCWIAKVSFGFGRE